jgi:predicted enzyme related to lactoylglutathione lyase
VLSVDDVDATYARVLEQGATSVAAPKDRPEWMARTAHITDPDGHLVEIYTSLTPSQS